MKLKCKYCMYCRGLGRQESQKGRLGRIRYFCANRRLDGVKDKHGYYIGGILGGFIGFGEHNYESPLAMKTTPRWCPLKGAKTE